MVTVFVLNNESVLNNCEGDCAQSRLGKRVVDVGKGQNRYGKVFLEAR